jgi:hypothetical protein
MGNMQRCLPRHAVGIAAAQRRVNDHERAEGVIEPLISQLRLEV